jgi:hypothetical protein
MPKLGEGTFALSGLAVLAIWVLGVLPFLYSSTPDDLARVTALLKTFELIWSPAVGAIFGILTVMLVEYLRRPKLRLTLGDRPRPFPQQPNAPAQVLRSARLNLTTIQAHIG